MSIPEFVIRAPFLTNISIAVPWFAALVLPVYRRHMRTVGCMAAIVSIAASAMLLWGAPKGESLYQALMLLFSCLTLAATLLLPRRDCTVATISGMLFLLGSTLLAYSTENLLVLLAAWILSSMPFLVAGWFRAHTWRPLVGLLLSSCSLMLAIGLISADTNTISLN